jgi:hypothetical protein
LQAISVEGQEGNLQTDYVLKVTFLQAELENVGNEILQEDVFIQFDV